MNPPIEDTRIKTEPVPLPAEVTAPKVGLIVKKDADGNYIMEPGVPTGPAAPVWSYTDPVPTDMYAPIISGAQRLPNGNTLICSGVQGRVLEVTPDGRIVWDLRSQYLGDAEFGDVPANSLYRAVRFPKAHPGLAEREL